MNKNEILRKKKIKSWLKSYKETINCIICGERQAECLDFHHIKPKFKQVNEMVSDGYSKIRIMNEIGKCIVLCGNCHRRKHHEKLVMNGIFVNQNRSRRQWLIKIKENLGCYNCNAKDYVIIDFHHLRNKNYGINYMVSRFSKEKTMVELSKCIPLCVNCHRKIHNELIEIDLTDYQLKGYWEDHFNETKTRDQF